MLNSKKIHILYSQIAKNAPADEVDTLEQLELITKEYAKMGWQVLTLPFDESQTINQLIKDRPQIIFNLVESIHGLAQYSYLAPAIFDLLKIPYTGCSSQTIAITSDKVLSKSLLQASGLPTPTWLTSELCHTLKTLPAKKYIVKSRYEEGSFGLSQDCVIENATPTSIAELIANKTNELGGVWFAESFIDGREIHLALIGKLGGMQALPPSEIIFPEIENRAHKIYDYKTKWDVDSAEWNNTDFNYDLSANNQLLIDQLTGLALEAAKIFGLSGYARIDFRLDSNNNPYIIEVNANPCLMPYAGFINAAEQCSLNFENVLQILVDTAISH